MSGSVGSDPKITWQVAPTGGIVILKMKSAAPPASWSLVRAVVSGSDLIDQTTLFESPSSTLPVVVDIGDGTLEPLDPNLVYQYTFTTSSGTAVTTPISPATSITIEPDPLTSILMRALQSGVRALTIPAAFHNRPEVFHAMPINRQPPLPMISINDTLLQQGDIPIGQNNLANFRDNTQTIGGQAMHHYTIAVMTSTVKERLFYRDAVLAIFNAALGSILQAIGQNSSHRFQVHSSQVVGTDTQPGFFYSEILLEITGVFAVGVTTSFQTIEQITGTSQTGQFFIDPPGQ
jgi:hypothetical protein